VKIGYTKNTLDLHKIEQETRGYPACYYPYNILDWMARGSGHAYAIILLIEDDGEYVGHAIVNYSEMPMRRVSLPCFFISEKKRNAWLTYWFYYQIEGMIKAMFPAGEQVRMTVHVAADDCKWAKHVVEFGKYRKEARLEDYVAGKAYIQYYKLLRGTHENLPEHKN